MQGLESRLAPLADMQHNGYHDLRLTLLFHPPFTISPALAFLFVLWIFTRQTSPLNRHR